MTTGRADVAGLGQVVEQYVLVEDDTKAGCVTYHGQVHWQVAGKGTITFAVKTPDCLVPLTVVCDRILDYMVTGGTGAFRHASGRGTFGIHRLSVSLRHMDGIAIGPPRLDGMT